LEYFVLVTFLLTA